MLFINNGSNDFTESALQANLKIGAQSWTTDFADIDNDGDLDAFIANHYDDCQLMINDGNGKFTDATNNSGLMPYVGANFGAFAIQSMFHDFNNDGFVDLLFTGTQHFLFLNDGDGSFTRSANPFVGEQIESVAVGDLDHDGYLDVYAGYAKLFNEPSNISDRLFINQGSSNNFIAIQLEGVESNRNGIGSRIEIYGEWGIQIREVRSGHSYGIMNTLTQHFGLGRADQIEKIVVKWPSGNVQEINNPNINQFIQIKERASCVDQPCNDFDECTINDRFDEDCNCIGELLDSDNDGVCNLLDLCEGFNDAIDTDGDGIPNGCDDCNNALIGTACNDQSECTVNDVYNENCECIGTLIDQDNDGICDSEDACPNLNNSLIGRPCDDGNECTTGEFWNSDCECSGGIYIDADNDGYCKAQDPNDNDACIPNSSAANCNEITTNDTDCQNINFTDFENGDMSIWRDGGYAARLYSSADLANSGVYSFYIQDNKGARSSLYTEPLSLSSYDYLTLSFSLLTNQIETNDAFVIEISNYGNYEIYETLVAGLDFPVNERASLTINLAGPFTNIASIRIRSIANSSTDYFIFDDINLKGCFENAITTNCNIGQTCDDGDPCTEGETFDANCNCTGGQFQDADNDGVCDSNDQCHGFDDKLIGSPCDDGNDCTIGERYNNSCGCSGGVYIDNDQDGLCIGEDPNDNDPCIPNISNTNCGETPDQYFCDLISSTNFEGGNMGIWRDGGSYARIIDASIYANSGSYSFYIRGNQGSSSSLYTAPINLSNSSVILLQFYFFAVGMESGDRFHVEVNTGNGYQIAKTYLHGRDFVTDEKRIENLVIDDFDLSNNTRIRFRVQGNLSTDYVFLDDISVQGCIEENACTPGEACDDGDPCTIGDVLDENCNCVEGDYIDLDNDGFCAAEDPNDNDACIPDSDHPNCTSEENDALDCTLISSVDFEGSQRGVWNDGGSFATILHTNTYANSGVYVFYIHGDAGEASSLYSDPLNLVGVDEVKLTFNYLAHQMEEGDRFLVEVATDDSYQVVKSYVEGIQFKNNDRKDATLIIKGFSFTENTRIRFRAECSERTDYIMLDDIKIEKCSYPNLDNPDISLRQNKVESQAFSVYPNPANEYLNIDFPDDSSQAYKLHIFDLQGRLVEKYVFDQSKVVLNISDWPNEQVYLLKYISENHEVSTLKLFKQ